MKGTQNESLDHKLAVIFLKDYSIEMLKTSLKIGSYEYGFN
jgi:hypothetical protein